MDNYVRVINGDIDNAWVRVRRITVKARDFGIALDKQYHLRKAIDELGTIEAWLNRDDDTGIHPVRARELLGRVQEYLDSASNYVDDRIIRAYEPNIY